MLSGIRKAVVQLLLHVLNLGIFQVIFRSQLAEILILLTGTLLWAKWANLDLGLRAPSGKNVWVWVLLYVVWIAVEQISLTFWQTDINVSRPQETSRLSNAEYLVVVVALGPLQEEVLFRGALFSALRRRWGLVTAVVIPSAVWGLLHIEYEPLYIASIAASGALLAIIRWKSSSIYIPLALHVGGNLLDMIILYG